jgi:hypothetical protein
MGGGWNRGKPLSGFTFAQPWRLQQRFDFPTAGAMTLKPDSARDSDRVGKCSGHTNPTVILASHRLHDLLCVNLRAHSSDDAKCVYVSRAVA